MPYRFTFIEAGLRNQGLVEQEFIKVEEGSRTPDVFILQMQVLHKEIDKPRKGYVVYADGVNWNPGSGEGLYRYDGTAWKFIG